MLFEVEAGVKTVISTENSQQIDHDVSPTDEVLESLGIIELSDTLESQLRVELPSFFVFNNPTIVDMSHCLHMVVSQQVVHQHLDNEERKAPMYAVKWIQSSFHDSKLNHINDDRCSRMAFVELSGCLPFSTPWLEEISASTISLSDTISPHSEKIPTILVAMKN